MSFNCGWCNKEHPVPTKEEDQAGQPCVAALARERDALVLQLQEANERELQQLRRFAKDREERAALVLQVEELQKRIKVGAQQIDGLLFAAEESNRLIEGMKNRLTQIIQSDDTTRMAGEQILMGYNAHKDLARAALSEVEYPEKRNHEGGGKVLIKLNGKDIHVANSLSYDDIVELAGEREGASIVVKPADRKLAGFSLIKGQFVDVTEGMIIGCIMTGNA